MATKSLFKSHLPSVNYIFKNGKPAVFIRNCYTTDIQSEIDELTAEINAGHPILFIDDAEPQREVDNSDLVSGLREKLRAEIMAEMAAASALANDRGSSEDTKLNPASTTDVAVATVGGASLASLASLATLAAKVASKE